MNPFLDSHLRTAIEDIRLLEAYVTAPLGLYSDLRMLRESAGLPHAAELPREEAQHRRMSYGALTDSPLDVALHAVESVRCSLEILEAAKGVEEAHPGPSWISQARRVLDRVEQRVAADLRSETASGIKGLCVTVASKGSAGRPVGEIAESVLRGGVSVIRLNGGSVGKGLILPVARRLRELCDAHDALFIVGEDADLALAVPAHGLHLAQTDLPIAEARRVLEPRQIVGSSSETVEGAVDSQARGADYIEIAEAFPASEEESSRSPAGLQMVSRVKELVTPPVMAVGGVTAENVAEVVRAGADCVSVGGEVTEAEDPQAATGRMVRAMEAA